MSNDTKYNGWTNYPTWRVNLELADDYIHSLVEDRQTFDGVSHLADAIQEYVEEIVAPEDTTLTQQYAMAFIGDVNYWEIASTAIADNPELLDDSDDD